MSGLGIEEVALALVTDVLANNVHSIEKRLAEEPRPWEQVIRHELDLEQLLSHDLKDEPSLVKLLSFDMRTLSLWHLAAALGNTDILVNFLDKDIGVDLASAGGTTALHLASFSGQASTVRILTFVYHANINRTDRYGWSALHYAASGGDIDVVQMLLDEGCDLRLRDKDGTTAAFRAKTEGHTYIAELLTRVGGAHLLDVHENTASSPEPQTPTKVFQFKTIEPVTKPEVPRSMAVDRSETKYGMVLPRQHSTPEFGQHYPLQLKEQTRSNTLPTKAPKPAVRQRSIRRIIREQLEEAFSPEPLYETPVTPGEKMDNDRVTSKPKPQFGFGMETLKGILKEEILKYKEEVEAQKHNDNMYESLEEYQANISACSSASAADLGQDCHDDIDDEPPYMHAPSPPVSPGGEKAELPSRKIDIPPPLPPRRFSSDSINLYQGEAAPPNLVTDKAVLLSAVKRLAPKLGKQWQNVALALPIDTNKSKTNQRICRIIKQYPADEERQAMVAFTEWVINHGQTANIDDVITALRGCGLNQLVVEIQSFTQEFSA